MECEHIEKLISLYWENELSSQEKADVEDHLKSCKHCSFLFSSLKETTEILSSFSEWDVPRELKENLYQISKQTKKFRLGRGFFLRPSLQPVMSIATVLLTVVSFYFFNPNRSEINKSISRNIHLGYSKIERLYVRAEEISEDLEQYKNNILVSLKNKNLIKESNNQKTNNGG